MVYLGLCMPHLTLEYSNNVIEKQNFLKLFAQLHALLAETLPTNINSVKSRAVGRAVYLVGEGDPDDAFIHINLQVLPGRSAATLKKCSAEIVILLQQFFKQSLETLKLQISVEIAELEQFYCKA